MQAPLLFTLALVPTSLPAQRVTEYGLHAVGTISGNNTLVAGGLYGAMRFSDRSRAALTAALGGDEGGVAFRGELLGHFLLNPRILRPALYAIGGVAWQVGATDQGFAVLGVGIESAPGAHAGWALEAGFGGGLRLSLGYRWRNFPARWRPQK